MIYKVNTQAELKCKICGSSLEQSIDYPRLENRNATIKFEKIYLCGICDTGTATPLKTQGELDKYYSSRQYWHKTDETNIFLSMHNKNQAKYRIEKCLPYLNKNKLHILDIGAGEGWISYWLDVYKKNKILKLDIIEPDEELVLRILERECSFNINNLVCLEDSNEEYDFIFINHVVEHVADPIKFLKAVVRKLNKNGVIYFEVPHKDWEFKQDVFPHTYFFSKNSLLMMSKTMGLNTYECNIFGREGIDSSRLNVLRNRLKEYLFILSVKLKVNFIVNYTDNALWKYSKNNNNGIWLQWIVGK